MCDLNAFYLAASFLSAVALALLVVLVVLLALVGLAGSTDGLASCSSILTVAALSS